MNALPTLRAATSPARWLLAVSLFVGALPPASADAAWPKVRSALFGERRLHTDSAVLALEAPDRAEDASMVPVALHVGPAGGALRTLWLLVDENPSPLAARFTLHDAVVGSIETRLRVDNADRTLAVGMTAYVLLPLQGQ